jgi:hypothetical protein
MPSQKAGRAFECSRLSEELKNVSFDAISTLMRNRANKRAFEHLKKDLNLTTLDF